MKDFLEACDEIADILATRGYKHLRFAVVLWRDDAEKPTVAGSNDPSSEQICRMLTLASNQICDDEPSDIKIKVMGNA